MMPHNHEEHLNKNKVVKCSVITVSDTRTTENDTSGKLMMEKLKNSGHSLITYEIVPDDQEKISSAIQRGLQNEEIQAILVNGGTGIAQRDVTIEVVKKMLEKEMNGFGELFRYLSYTEDIGSAAILSRAIAGISKKKVVFSVPGSTGAVKLAMDKLILPELVHIIWELTKDQK
ncbi:MogA/MoaB family molybdenum cofactor biosynthesis protein [Bacillus spongiae]|uniref:Molybdenum cofactor biosynthesis protein B n=1 Tax=Bacillus spongiae TaxID=2683610 RepID=A0ABU8HGC3_9BACI